MIASLSLSHLDWRGMFKPIRPLHSTCLNFTLTFPQPPTQSLPLPPSFPLLQTPQSPSATLSCCVLKFSSSPLKSCGQKPAPYPPTHTHTLVTSRSRLNYVVSKESDHHEKRRDFPYFLIIFSHWLSSQRCLNFFTPLEM